MRHVLLSKLEILGEGAFTDDSDLRQPMLFGQPCSLKALRSFPRKPERVTALNSA